MHLSHINKEVSGRHDWRQSQTMWNVRNFVNTDMNIMNPRIGRMNPETGDSIYRYEFPLMQWVIAMLQRIFGESIVLVRLFLFLVFCFTTVGLYKLSCISGLGDWPSFIGAYLFVWSPIAYYYCINPIPDNLALCAGVWYLYFIVKNERKFAVSSLLLAGLSLLIATACKLPFLMFSIVSIYFFIRGILAKEFKRRILEAFLLLLIITPAILWYAWVIPQWGHNTIKTGLFNSDFSGIGRIIGYHISTMFPLRLLTPNAWLYFGFGVVLLCKGKVTKWVNYLILITFIYLVIEIIPIGTDHDYYMMPFLPWMYIVVASGVGKVLMGNQKFLKYILWFMLITAPLVTYVICKDFWSLEKSFLKKSVYVNQEVLRGAVPDDKICVIGNDYSTNIFPYLINKRGYIFYNDELSSSKLESLINDQNATYLYSNSRSVEGQENFDNYLDSLILQVEDIKVFKLKFSETD